MELEHGPLVEALTDQLFVKTSVTNNLDPITRTELLIRVHFTEQTNFEIIEETSHEAE